MIKRFFRRLRDLFVVKSKTSDELEDEYTEQILREESDALRETYERELPATVIAYEPDEDTDYGSSNTVVLVDDYKCRMLPSDGSIIWIPVDAIMRPFKFVRFDFVQTDNEYDSMRVYIVVTPALNTDIVTYR